MDADERDVLKPGEIVSERFSRRDGRLLAVERAGDDVSEAVDDGDSDDELDSEPLPPVQAPKLPHVRGDYYSCNDTPAVRPPKPAPQPAPVPRRGIVAVGGMTQSPTTDGRFTVVTTPVGFADTAEASVEFVRDIQRATQAGRDDAAETVRAAIAAAVPSSEALDNLRARLQALEGDLQREQKKHKTASSSARAALRAGTDATKHEAAVDAADVAIARLEKRLNTLRSEVLAEERSHIASVAESRKAAKTPAAKSVADEARATMQQIADELAAAVVPKLRELARFRGVVAWCEENAY